MANNYDENYKKAQERFIATTKGYLDTKQGKPDYRYSLDLTNDVIGYIDRQVNEYSETASINDIEYNSLLVEAIMGLYTLIYCTNFSTDLIAKEPLFISAKNLLILKYSLVRGGRQDDTHYCTIQTS